MFSTENDCQQTRWDPGFLSLGGQVGPSIFTSLSKWFSSPFLVVSSLCVFFVEKWKRKEPGRLKSKQLLKRRSLYLIPYIYFVFFHLFPAVSSRKNIFFFFRPIRPTQSERSQLFAAHLARQLLLHPPSAFSLFSSTTSSSSSLSLFFNLFGYIVRL